MDMPRLWKSKTRIRINVTSCDVHLMHHQYEVCYCEAQMDRVLYDVYRHDEPLALYIWATVVLLRHYWGLCLWLFFYVSIQSLRSRHLLAFFKTVTPLWLHSKYGIVFIKRDSFSFSHPMYRRPITSNSTGPSLTAPLAIIFWQPPRRMNTFIFSWSFYIYM